MEMMAPLWKKNFGLVRREDTEIVLRTSEWGVLGMDGLFNPAMNSLNTQLIFHLCKNAEQEGAVIDACEDIPKSFLVCDHPYHRQIVYLSQLNSRTLLGRAEEQERTK